MHRSLSIASATFALAVALTAYEASAPAASKEAPKPAQALATLEMHDFFPNTHHVEALAILTLR